MDSYQFIMQNHTEGYTFFCGYNDFKGNDEIHPITIISAWAENYRNQVEDAFIDAIGNRSAIKKSDELMRQYRPYKYSYEGHPKSEMHRMKAYDRAVRNYIENQLRKGD